MQSIPVIYSQKLSASSRGNVMNYAWSKATEQALITNLLPVWKGRVS